MLSAYSRLSLRERAFFRDSHLNHLLLFRFRRWLEYRQAMFKERTMHVELAPGWDLDLERGPDWLFIRLRPPRHGDTVEAELAEALWERLEQSFTYRVVLEMDDLWLLRSWMIGELVKLHKRISGRGGRLRLCGLSEDNQDVLRQCRLDECFPSFRTRADAVRGQRPPQPR